MKKILFFIFVLFYTNVYALDNQIEEIVKNLTKNQNVKIKNLHFLFIPVDKKTRPLKDMVRESIFNILNHSNLLKKEIDKCYVLDLFSGIGSFGLEAISRGAKKVVFYEDYKPAIHLLTKNINNLKFDQKAEVKKINIYSYISIIYKFKKIYD